MKKIALCYDFDGTLCSGYMQNQKLIPDCNLDVKEFWTSVTENSKKIISIQLYLTCIY